jgi:hypothetical protein
MQYVITNNFIYTKQPYQLLQVFPALTIFLPDKEYRRTDRYRLQESVADVNQEILHNQLLAIDDFLINSIELPFK